MLLMLLSTTFAPMVVEVLGQQAAPSVWLSASSGYVHDPLAGAYASRIYVTGLGFNPATDVVLYWTLTGAVADVAYTTLVGQVADQCSILPVGLAPAVARTDGTGWFKLRVTVPQVPSGVYVVKALTGAAAFPFTTTRSASASFTVNPRVAVYRVITATGLPGPSDGYPGESVRYVVSGFRAGETAILTWSSTLAGAWVNTGAMVNGFAAVTGVLPAGLPAVPAATVGGLQTITATGDLGTTGVSCTFTVKPQIISLIWTSMVAGAIAANPILAANLAGSGFTGTTVVFVRIVVFSTTGTQTAFTTTLPGAPALGIGLAGTLTAGQFALGVIPQTTALQNVAPGVVMAQIVTDAGNFNMTDIDDGSLTGALAVRQTWLASALGGGATVFLRSANTPVTTLSANVGDTVTVYGTGFPAGTTTIAASATTPIAVGAERIASAYAFVFDTGITRLTAANLPPNYALPVGSVDRTVAARTVGLVADQFAFPPNVVGTYYYYIGRVDRAWLATDVLNLGFPAVAGAADPAFAVNAWGSVPPAAPAWTAGTPVNAPIPWAVGGGTLTVGAFAAGTVQVATSIGGHAAYWLEIGLTVGAAGQGKTVDHILPAFGDPAAFGGAVNGAQQFDALAVDARGAWWATFSLAPNLRGNLYLAAAYAWAVPPAYYQTVTATIALSVVPALFDDTLGVNGPGSVLVPAANRAGTARVADVLRIFGEGFAAPLGVGEPVTIAVNGIGTSPPTQTTPDVAYGDFLYTAATAVGFPFAIQAGTPNLATDAIAATGPTSGNTANATFTFTPDITIAPIIGNVGATTIVTIQGLSAGISHVITWGAADHANATILATRTSLTDGTITASVVIPDSVGTIAGAIHLIDLALASAPTASLIYAGTTLPFAANAMYGAALPSDVRFSVRTSQVSTPGAQAPGYTVSVTCRGLDYVTNYYIWFGPAGLTTLIAGPVQSNAVGTVTIQFTVPNCTAGQFIDTSTSAVTDTSTATVGRDRTAFAPIIAMTISPTSGSVGDTINVLAVGLITGTSYQVYWYLPSDVQTPGQIPTTALGPMTTLTGDAVGVGTGSFPVPPSAVPGQTYKVDLSTSLAYPLTVLTIGVPSFTIGAQGFAAISTIFSDTTVTVGFELTGNIYDDSAALGVAALRVDPKITFLKTNAAYINQATGAPTWSGYDHLVAFGGRNANPTTAYYEDKLVDPAPIKFEANATHYRFLKAGVVQYAVLKTSITPTNDYFVLEVVTDGTHKVFILWGLEQYGTYGSGVFLVGKWSTISTLSQGWYIVNVSGTYPYPYPGSYTIVASGT